MFPQTDKCWRDYRALNQNWSYQTTFQAVQSCYAYVCSNIVIAMNIFFLNRYV